MYIQQYFTYMDHRLHKRVILEWRETYGGEPYNIPVSIACREFPGCRSGRGNTKQSLLVSLGWENQLSIQRGQSREFTGQKMRRESHIGNTLEINRGFPWVCSSVLIRPACGELPKAEERAIMKEWWNNS